MKIEYYHASKYGNGARVAEEFRKQMNAAGVAVSIHHIREVKPNDLPPADLYLFSSPGRFGGPLGEVSRFLKDVKLAPGTKYAILTTEIAPRPDRNGKMPAAGEPDKYQRVIPAMNQILQAKELVNVAQGTVLVAGLKGPLEDGWQKKVEALVHQIYVPALSDNPVSREHACVS